MYVKPITKQHYGYQAKTKKPKEGYAMLQGEQRMKKELCRAGKIVSNLHTIAFEKKKAAEHSVLPNPSSEQVGTLNTLFIHIQ